MMSLTETGPPQSCGFNNVKKWKFIQISSISAWCVVNPSALSTFTWMLKVQTERRAVICGLTRAVGPRGLILVAFWRNVKSQHHKVRVWSLKQPHWSLPFQFSGFLLFSLPICCELDQSLLLMDVAQTRRSFIPRWDSRVESLRPVRL